MLDLMRRHAYSWITRVVLGLIVVVFAFWGIGTGFFNQVHPVATVDGKQILGDEIDREADQIRQTLQSVYGQNAPAILKSINLRQEALDRIIENRLIANEARHVGIYITKEAIADKIATQRGFQVNGQFDFAAYQDVLRENGLTPTEYEASMRSAMIADTLQSMVYDGVQVSADEVRHAFNLANQKIGLAYIEVPWSQFSARINPTDQQIADFYKAHTDAFREPKRVKIAFIHYEPLVLAANITPSDKEIEDFYKRNLKSRFTHPDMVHASHILIAVPAGATDKEKADAKARAEDILKQAHSGADFKKLAAKYSEDPSNRLDGGDLGFFGRGQMIKPFEDAVFKMKPGEIELVETSFGYHVVKLNEFRPAHTDTLAEARPKIIDEIRSQAGNKLAREALDQDLSAALGGASIQDIAKKRGLDAVEPAPFARNEPISGVPQGSKVSETAFGLEKGQVRAVPDPGAPYLVKVLDIIPSHIPPLKDIASKVRDVYIRATAEDDARDAARRLLAQIKSPDDFQSVARAAKIDIRTVEPFQRSTHEIPGIGEFPEALDAAGLVTKVPSVIDRVMEHDGNSYIFQETSRSDPSDDEWKAAEKSFTQEYVDKRRAQAWTQFLQQLKSRATIVINADQLGTPTSSSM